MTDELEKLRSQIDSTDNKIVELLKNRMSLSAAVAGVKAREGLPVYVPEREAQLLRRIEMCSGEELAPYIRAVYSAILSASREYQTEKLKNIILVGMPGCGKSSVGKLLAEKLGKAFYDTDCLIEEIADCTIPEILENSGEAMFRETEHKMLTELMKVRGAVIATGGGTVLREDNRELLRRDSVIIWLKRDVDLLPTEDRPISKMVPLEELYRQRAPIYASLADYEIDNDCGSPEAAADKLISVVKL